MLQTSHFCQDTYGGRLKEPVKICAETHHPPDEL